MGWDDKAVSIYRSRTIQCINCDKPIQWIPSSASQRSATRLCHKCLVETLRRNEDHTIFELFCEAEIE